jgi:hypothetical protein
MRAWGRLCRSAEIVPDSGSVLVRQSTVHIEIFTVGCRAESESEDKQDCGFIFFLVPNIRRNWIV